MNFLGDIYIHISQCARSDHISQRQYSKVWWEEEETQVDNGSPVKQSELWVNHHLTPNLSFHNTVQVKFHNHYES